MFFGCLVFLIFVVDVWIGVCGGCVVGFGGCVLFGCVL